MVGDMRLRCGPGGGRLFGNATLDHPTDNSTPFVIVVFSVTDFLYSTEVLKVVYKRYVFRC